MIVLARNERMTPKERVLTTFAFGKPDRLPISYFANGAIDRRLHEHFQVGDGHWVGEALGVDFRGIGPWYKGPRLHAEVPGINVDPAWGIHTRWIQHESGGYCDYCDFPLRTADEEAVANWPMPSPDDFEYGHIEESCRQNERFAIHVGNPGLADVINSCGFLRGMEQVLVDLITDDPAGLLLAKRRTEINLEVTRRTLELARGRVDFMWLGEDLGTQIAPTISLELYRRHIRPLHQQFVDLAKAYNLPVMIHTCGSSSWAYEDFIEMGINGVDTLQPEAANMSPRYLKDHFGGRLFFHGCISTAGPVAFGTPAEVTQYCRDILDVMMPGGGYCFAPTHSLQDNSPTENVVAMYETAHAYGRY